MSAVVFAMISAIFLLGGWREWMRRRDLRKHGPDLERIPYSPTRRHYLAYQRLRVGPY